jgi:hypothetical protein
MRHMIIFPISVEITGKETGDTEGKLLSSSNVSQMSQTYHNPINVDIHKDDKIAWTQKTTNKVQFLSEG